MQHQEFEPPEVLRSAIKCFWYDKRNFGEQLSGIEVVPDSYAEIIFHFGSGCSISYHGSLESLPSPFMIGLLNQPVTFYAQHDLQIIGVRCFAWTVFDLLGLEPGKDGVRNFEHPIARLQTTLEKCVNAGKIEEALLHVEQYFLKAQLQVAQNSILFKAGIAMSKANGKMPVNEVAAAAHTTLRTLERKFRHASGYSVKDVSGLMRFEQARNHLWLYPDCNLTALAHDLGYSDQSHLSKEFKRYSGTTPAAFARKAKKEKRFVSNDFVAFIQSKHKSNL